MFNCFVLQAAKASFQFEFYVYIIDSMNKIQGTGWPLFKHSSHSNSSNCKGFYEHLSVTQQDEKQYHVK